MTWWRGLPRFRARKGRHHINSISIIPSMLRKIALV
jgi:hypothetical protein